MRLEWHVACIQERKNPKANCIFLKEPDLMSFAKEAKKKLLKEIVFPSETTTYMAPTMQVQFHETKCIFPMALDLISCGMNARINP